MRTKIRVNSFWLRKLNWRKRRVTSNSNDFEKVTVNRPLRNSFLLFVLVTCLATVIYCQVNDSVSVGGLSQHVSWLRGIQEQNQVLFCGLACLIYIVLTALPFPVASALTLFYGWYFGLIRGLVIVSVSSTAGATLAFLLSRYLFREVFHRRFQNRLENYNRAFQQDGVYFLFTLRLIPGIPFFLVNALMGLTTIPLRTFWWVSQIGMLPGTAVYIYAGSSVPNIQLLSEQGLGVVFTANQLTRIFLGLFALGLFPLLVRFVMPRITRLRRH